MRIKIQLAIGLALTAFVMMACDQLPTNRGPDIVVVDLDAIAKATGQDAAIERQVENTRNELSSELADTLADLEAQLNQEIERLGESATEAERREFQQMTTQSRQQFAQSQAIAQQKAEQFQTKLVMEFRQRVQPIAAEIGAKRGAKLALLPGPSMLWFEGTVDITDEVLAALRAQPSILESPADQNEGVAEPSGAE